MGYPKYAVKAYDDPRDAIAVTYPTHSWRHWLYAVPELFGYPVNAEIARDFLNESGGRKTGNEHGNRAGRIVFQLWFALWPFYLGVLLPYLLPGERQFVNVPWSLIDGLGMFPEYAWEHRGLGGGAVAFFGFFIWPLVVSAVFYWLGGKVWRSQYPVFRYGAAILMVVSSFAVLPAESVDHSPHPWRSTYFFKTIGL